MRKSFLMWILIGLVLLTTINIVPNGSAVEPPYSWTDHMDYDTLSDMEEEGWSINAPDHTFLNQSSVVLEFIEPPTTITYRGFPEGIDQWRAETRGMWTEGSGGGIGVTVATETVSYGLSFDGWYSQFSFYKGGDIVKSFGSLSLERYQWYILTMELSGNTFNFYLNGQYLDSYTETAVISAAVGMDSVSPWMSTNQFDYYHFEAVESGNPANTWTSWREVISGSEGGVETDVGYSAAASGDGGYALLGMSKTVGSSNYNASLIRVDYAGNILWENTYDGGSADYVYCMDNCTDGGFVITGAAYNDTLGHYQLWLFKVDATGNLVWDQRLGSGSYEVGFGVDQTSDGGYIVTGYTNGTDVVLIKTDGDGLVQWERSYQLTGTDWGKAVIQTVDNGYCVAGWTTSFGVDPQAYVLRTAPDGTKLWDNHFGNGSSYAYGLTEMSDGGFVISGYTDGMGSGMSDLYAVRIDDSGSMVWENAYGTAGDELGASVFPVEGGLLIGGQSSSDTSLAKVMVVQTDLEGEFLGSSLSGFDDVPIFGSVVVQNPDGSYLAIGHTNESDSGNDELCAMRIVVGSGVALPGDHSFIEKASGPLGAVVLGSGVGLLAFLVAGSGNALLAIPASKGAMVAGEGKMTFGRRFRLGMVWEFVTGYVKSHITGKFFKKMGKYEPEKGVAQERRGVFLTFSWYELAAMAFASIVLGVTFMIAKKLDLLRPDLLLLYIAFAGVVLIADDLAHRFVARKYKAVTEYQFWFLGSVIMFVTAFVFGSVFALPARIIINDTEKLTPKQKAMIYGAGPLMSFLIFLVFLLLVPIGGSVIDIALLGASMHLLSAVYSFMPFDPMDGNKVYRWRKTIWALAFVPLLVLYFAMVIWVF